MEKWHNMIWTRKAKSGKLEKTSDFEYSVSEAVENDLFHNRGIHDLVSVEFSGPAGGSHFQNVTDIYLKLYYKMSHSTVE